MKERIRYQSQKERKIGRGIMHRPNRNIYFLARLLQFFSTASLRRSCPSTNGLPGRPLQLKLVRFVSFANDRP